MARFSAGYARLFTGQFWGVTFMLVFQRVRSFMPFWSLPLFTSTTRVESPLTTVADAWLADKTAVRVVRLPRGQNSDARLPQPTPGRPKQPRPPGLGAGKSSASTAAVVK